MTVCYVALTAPLLAVVACMGDPGAGAGGAGGVSSCGPAPLAAVASHGAQASSITSSSGAPDAGSDAPVDAGCSACAAALNGPDHEAAEAAFCAGSEAFARWADYVSCGCVYDLDAGKAGPCGLDCAATAYCAGVYPKPGTWADPTGACAVCLAVTGPTGCGDQAYWCQKN